MANSSGVNSGGIGFFSLLALLFIGLKLTGHLTWPWLWVLSPIWIPISVVLVIVMCVFGYAMAQFSMNRK